MCRTMVTLVVAALATTDPAQAASMNVHSLVGFRALRYAPVSWSGCGAHHNNADVCSV